MFEERRHPVWLPSHAFIFMDMLRCVCVLGEGSGGVGCEGVGGLPARQLQGLPVFYVL